MTDFTSAESEERKQYADKLGRNSVIVETKHQAFDALKSQNQFEE